VDAARELAGGDVTLLHVTDAGTAAALAGGLLGRSGPSTGARILADTQDALLSAAEHRLGHPAARLTRSGLPEREVVAACGDADLLILARDGDHTRLGPRSLGHATRFVVDHAPCRVLLVWPDLPPELATIAPPKTSRPPKGPPPKGPPPPPHRRS
jgi:nucleotide-binding universal stress UspA family protein